MEDNDKIRQRFELIKMARELLNEDYINRRAQDHNKWIAENDELWRTTRRNVPYPPFAQYPTDEEIVRAASNLYNFIYIEKSLPPVTNTVSGEQKNVTTDVLDEFPPTEESPAPVDDHDIIPETEDNKDKQEANMHVEENLQHSFLPGWIRRNK